MGIQISGYEDFERKFNKLKHLRDIFLFVLYDSSERQQPVARFVRDKFRYLDELAGASETFIFLFTPSEMGAGAVPNPGPNVAASFDIRPNQLPGVLVFCLGDDGRSFGDGTYLSLDESMFQEDPNAIEDSFADLFSMIQDTGESEELAPERIELLRKKIEQARRARDRRPLIASLKAGTISVITFAGELALAVAPAWIRH